MQTVADLRFFQFAQIGVGGVEQALFFFCCARAFEAQIEMQVVAQDVVEDLTAQQFGAARVEHQGFVVFIHLAFEIARGAVAFGARQRWHEVVDDHRLGTALGLGAFTRVVDDEGVEIGHRAERQIGPALLGQRHALAR